MEENEPRAVDMSTTLQDKSNGVTDASKGPRVSRGSQSGDSTRSSTAAWLLPAMVGVAVALVVFLAGAWFVSGREDKYVASGSMVILPKPGDDAVESAYWETLGKGIVSTFAEVIRSAPITGAASGAGTRVTISPESSLLVVEGTANSARAAEQVAQLRIDAGLAAVVQLTTPFRVEIVDRPVDSAARSGLSKTSLIGASGMAALALGVAAAQGALVLRRPTHQTRG